MHFITLILFIIDQTVSPSNIDHWVCFPTGFWPVGLKIVFFLEFTIQTTQGMSLAADRAAPRAGIRTWEGTKTEWVIWKDPGSRQEEEVRTHSWIAGMVWWSQATGQGERQGEIMGSFQQVLGSSWCWTPDSMRADNSKPWHCIAFPNEAKLQLYASASLMYLLLSVFTLFFFMYLFIISFWKSIQQSKCNLMLAL